MLLASDLDGTLLPNTGYSWQEKLYDCFHEYVTNKNNGFELVYISGRDLGLVLKAIHDFRLPIPSVIATDVGSTIYIPNGEGSAFARAAQDSLQAHWQKDRQWQEEMRDDFAGLSNTDIQSLVAEKFALTAQEAARQTNFKISYYLPSWDGDLSLREELTDFLSSKGLRINVILSSSHNHESDENLGLLDILPLKASKESALSWIHQKYFKSEKKLLFAGDSGNDLLALSSSVPAVLVANAEKAVRMHLHELCAQRGTEKSIYYARGNYLAGILEAISYFYHFDVCPDHR